MFITFHTTPIQIFFHAYILFWPPSNSYIIHHFIIIPNLFFINTIFINSPHIFFIGFSLFITDTDPPFSLLLFAWNKLLILVTQIFLEANTTTQAHLKPLHFFRLRTVGFIFCVSSLE